MSDKSPGTAIALATGEALLAYLDNPIHADNAQREEGEEPKNFPAYVGFRGAKAEKNLDAMDAAGIKVDQFYLRDGGEFLPLVPCDLHILSACKLYTLEDDGKLQGVSFTDSQEQFDQGYRAQILATVGVRLGNGVFVPATLILRGGQTKALAAALDAIDRKKKGQATDPVAWAARSPKHADSAGAKLPGLRFFVRIYSTREGEGSGKYNLGHGSIVVTPKDDVAKLNDWIVADGARIAAALAVNEKRIADARAYASGEKAFGS